MVGFEEKNKINWCARMKSCLQEKTERKTAGSGHMPEGCVCFWQSFFI
ncbi:hypothetical protein [Anaerostipes hominis (ex Lee et al. 2021)]